MAMLCFVTANVRQKITLIGFLDKKYHYQDIHNTAMNITRKINMHAVDDLRILWLRRGPIQPSIFITSLALGYSYDYPSSSEATK